MYAEEIKKVFEQEILSRWTDWKPNQTQTSDWLKFISGFTAQEITDAVREYVKNHEMFTQPKLHLMVRLMQMQRKNRKGSRPQRIPVLLYSIQNVADKRKRYDFYGYADRGVDSDVLVKQSHERLAGIQQLYGGQYLIIQYWNSPRNCFSSPAAPIPAGT